MKEMPAADTTLVEFGGGETNVRSTLLKTFLSRGEDYQEPVAEDLRSTGPETETT